MACIYISDEAGAPIGFEQPGPSQGYTPAPGPSSYQPGPSSYQPGPSTSNSLNLPGNDTSPNGAQTGTHAPPSTPQEPQNASRPAPQQASYNTDWTPPPNSSLYCYNFQIECYYDSSILELNYYVYLYSKYDIIKIGE